MDDLFEGIGELIGGLGQLVVEVVKIPYYLGKGIWQAGSFIADSIGDCELWSPSFDSPFLQTAQLVAEDELNRSVYGSFRPRNDMSFTMDMVHLANDIDNTSFDVNNFSANFSRSERRVMLETDREIKNVFDKFQKYSERLTEIDGFECSEERKEKLKSQAMKGMSQNLREGVDSILKCMNESEKKMAKKGLDNVQSSFKPYFEELEAYRIFNEKIAEEITYSKSKDPDFMANIEKTNNAYKQRLDEKFEKIFQNPKGNLAQIKPHEMVHATTSQFIKDVKEVPNKSFLERNRSNGSYTKGQDFSKIKSNFKKEVKTKSKKAKWLSRIAKGVLAVTVIAAATLVAGLTFGAGVPFLATAATTMVKGLSAAAVATGLAATPAAATAGITSAATSVAAGVATAGTSLGVAGIAVAGATAVVVAPKLGKGIATGIKNTGNAFKREIKELNREKGKTILDEKVSESDKLDDIFKKGAIDQYSSPMLDKLSETMSKMDDSKQDNAVDPDAVIKNESEPAVVHQFENAVEQQNAARAEAKAQAAASNTVDEPSENAKARRSPGQSLGR